jgi:hypothetical protein
MTPTALSARRLNMLKNKLYDAAIALQEARQKLHLAQNRCDELYKKISRKHK